MDLRPDAAVPDGGYILRHRDLLEVRARPVTPATRLPHALRDRADQAWPEYL